MARHNVYIAEYQGQQGDAYALNTVQYRFRPAVVGGDMGWMTAPRGLTLWANWHWEMDVNDPTAPTAAEQLTLMQARRLR